MTCVASLSKDSVLPMKSNHIWQGLHMRYCGLQCPSISEGFFSIEMTCFKNYWNVTSCTHTKDSLVTFSLNVFIIWRPTVLFTLLNLQRKHFDLKADIKREMGFLTNVIVLNVVLLWRFATFSMCKSRPCIDLGWCTSWGLTTPAASNKRYLNVVDPALFTIHMPTLCRLWTTKCIVVGFGMSSMQAYEIAFCRKSCSFSTDVWWALDIAWYITRSILYFWCWIQKGFPVHTAKNMFSLSNRKCFNRSLQK